MKVDISEDGAMVDAHDLGPLLGLLPADVPLKMRSGEITSQSEAGIDQDAGNTRLTFWYTDIRVRITCDSSGTVIKTSRNKASQRR